MTLLEKYLKGDSASVHRDIRNLRGDAFRPGNREQVEAVYDETFRRVRQNFETIERELRADGYRFLADSYDAPSQPLAPPPADTDDLLAELNELVAPRHLPLSLQRFYRQVGSVDFGWDWQAEPELRWPGADPIVIYSVDQMLDWGIEEGVREIHLSPDDLNKDSGTGDSYYLGVSNYPSADTMISGYELFFIDYLRLTCQNCGFTMANKADNPGLTAFCERVRPMLVAI